MLAVFTTSIFISALVLGVFKGTIYAIMALGMVASSRINRVVNLGIPGLAVIGATAYFQMATVWGAPLVVALLFGLAAGSFFGAVLGLVNLKTTHWPRGFVMIATLTLSLFLFGWADKILPPIQVSPESIFGRGGFTVSLAFVQWHQVATLAILVVVGVLATWVIQRTRAGVYVRAIYDDPDSAATLGIPIGYFVVGVYAISGALAALAGIMAAPIVTLDSFLFLTVAIWALAGAILGGLEAFGPALMGSILIGVSQGVLGSGVLAGVGPFPEEMSRYENIGAILIVAVAVLYAGIKRRDLAHIQT
ncbi:MAG: branched-chain amino acid ABC transporter permease [Acidimicrobiia bacterium]